MTSLQAQPKTSKLAFSQYRATQTLRELAQCPFDLAKEGNLTPERIQKYTMSAAGYKLLYGTQRVTDEVIQALKDLAAESRAVDKMHHMQSGEVINLIEGYPSDQRSVLHTSMRDFFESPQTSKRAAEATAWEKKEVDKLKIFLQKNEKTFTDLICIGIGGSELGPHSVYLSLRYLQRPGIKVHFIQNIDPDAVAAVIKQVDLKKTLVSVVSKSGTTLETVTNEAFVRSRFEEAHLDASKHFVALTGKGSPMDDQKKYLECFYSWDYVGGRFCTTALYGAFLLAFALGFDNYWEFLRGANTMDKVALKKDVEENLPLMIALLGIWNRNFLKYPTLAIVPYSQALSRFSAYVQQVEMESNGKRIDKHGRTVDFDTCPIIWGEPGTNAQHSFYQMIHQGTSIVPLELIGFKESQYLEDFTFKGTTSQEKLLSNLFAQAIALAAGNPDKNPNQVFPGNRPSHIILGERLTPYSMGALFALYEHKAAFQGFIWNINSFDQEGVMLGKEVANKVLQKFTTRKHKGTGQPSASFPLGDACLAQLDSV